MDQTIEVDSLPTVRRLVDASTAPPLHPRGPRSVFELDERPIKLRRRMTRDTRLLVGRRIERTGGITRMVTMPLCETLEWQEREAARRARQKPPPPSNRYLRAGAAARPASDFAKFHQEHVYA